MDLSAEAADLLHALGLRGVIAGTALRTNEAAHSARALEDAGLAHRTPRGLTITPAGRDDHRRRSRLEPGSGPEAAVARQYRRFLPLNVDLLAIATAWQVGPGGAANDHADRSYDAAIVDRLGALHERAGPILTRTGAEAPRFGPYRTRLTHAKERVEAGSADWLCSPRVDSYHTVWMELHEEFLLALGLERS